MLRSPVAFCFIIHFRKFRIWISLFFLQGDPRLPQGAYLRLFQVFSGYEGEFDALRGIFHFKSYCVEMSTLRSLSHKSFQTFTLWKFVTLDSLGLCVCCNYSVTLMPTIHLIIMECVFLKNFGNLCSIFHNFAIFVFFQQLELFITNLRKCSGTTSYLPSNLFSLTWSQKKQNWETERGRETHTHRRGKLVSTAATSVDSSRHFIKPATPVVLCSPRAVSQLLLLLLLSHFPSLLFVSSTPQLPGRCVSRTWMVELLFLLSLDFNFKFNDRLLDKRERERGSRAEEEEEKAVNETGTKLYPWWPAPSVLVYRT